MCSHGNLITKIISLNQQDNIDFSRTNCILLCCSCELWNANDTCVFNYRCHLNSSSLFILWHFSMKRMNRIDFIHFNSILNPQRIRNGIFFKFKFNKKKTEKWSLLVTAVAADLPCCDGTWRHALIVMTFAHDYSGVYLYLQVLRLCLKFRHSIPRKCRPEKEKTTTKSQNSLN